MGGQKTSPPWGGRAVEWRRNRKMCCTVKTTLTEKKKTMNIDPEKDMSVSRGSSGSNSTPKKRERKGGDRCVRQRRGKEIARMTKKNEEKKFRGDVTQRK